MGTKKFAARVLCAATFLSVGGCRLEPLPPGVVTPDANVSSNRDVAALVPDAGIPEDINPPDALPSRDGKVSQDRPPVDGARDIPSDRGPVDALPLPPIDALPGGDLGTSDTSPPDPGPLPATWTEHWFSHIETLRLAGSNEHVAVYFDKDVNEAEASWILPHATKVWKYTKQTYGQLGGDQRLYWILHQGRYGGCHSSSYLQPSHDFRSVSDCGITSWIPSTDAMSFPARATGYIVENTNNDVNGSAAAALWRVRFAEFYEFDLYVGLGMDPEADAAYDRYAQISDNVPRANTYWFRDWFLPLWLDHGRGKFMATFFRLVAQHYPKVGNPAGRGMNYARSMNWGEFFHFMSGAAGVDLKPLATQAFGWQPEWDAQLAKARSEFAAIIYSTSPP